MLVRLAIPALDALRAVGEEDEALTAVGISKKSIAQTPQLNAVVDVKVDRQKVFQVWEMAAAHDPLVGLRAGSEGLARHAELVGYMARNSPTMGAAYERIARFKQLIDAGDVLHVDRTTTEVALRRTPVAGETQGPISYCEFALSGLLGATRKWTGVDVPVIAARFPYPAPPHAHAYEEVFGKNVTFDELNAEIVFSREVCELPLLGADTSLGDYLEAKAEAVIEAEHDWTFEDRVRETITYELTTGPTLDRVAKRLGMSGRTLQRRLSDERLHFSALVEQVRRSKAIEGVQNPKLFVSEVAAAIGYHDVQSFREAFVRWTGESPRAYRRTRREGIGTNGDTHGPGSEDVIDPGVFDGDVDSLGGLRQPPKPGDTARGENNHAAAPAEK